MSEEKIRVIKITAMLKHGGYLDAVEFAREVLRVVERYFPQLEWSYIVKEKEVDK